MTGIDRDRREGLGLIAGILIALGLTLGGYRSGRDDMLVLGIAATVVLAIWVIARPSGGADDGGGGNAPDSAGECGGDGE
ncbi:hypothetical protein [Roseovarius aestuariivivens]|uniref:hypothetical protein n=1 Tax=Roseovarius aestuariivivens TaxID=1888910 RepID=UPI0010810554|nr:hypothetical protein [Roseovarius aestuariivivens]